MEVKEVFEPIISFVKNFQKKEKDISKQAAKDRLKLVLMQDRASVSPDFFEMMKKEIIDVIKKYIEIDEDSLEVQLTRGSEAGLEGPALYANIPIKNIKPVASAGDVTGIMEREIQDIVNSVSDDILDEANKITDGAVSVSAEIESVVEDVPTVEEVTETVPNVVEETVEEVVEEEPKTADSIAENVKKEMLKTFESKQTTPKKTVKKASSAKTTTRRATKKKAVAE